MNINNNHNPSPATVVKNDDYQPLSKRARLDIEGNGIGTESITDIDKERCSPAKSYDKISSCSLDSSIESEQCGHIVVHETRSVKEDDDEHAITKEETVTKGISDIEYWKDLAEQRRIALEHALLENQKLIERVEVLETENRDLEEMLAEAKTLAEMINTMSEGDIDDSGIGKDLSTTFNTTSESVE